MDTASEPTERLLNLLKEAEDVIQASIAESLEQARDLVKKNDVNTVFIDLLSFGIEKSSSFVFDTRAQLPEIVFVLFQDQKKVEAQREMFFRGERSRFSHYYRLDKRTPVGSFSDELLATIRTCQNDLGWRMSEESLRKVFSRISDNKQASHGARPVQQADLIEAVERLEARPKAFVANTVFVSHRFAEADDGFVQGLTGYLIEKGFKVITGKLATGYISQAVIRRIKDAEFFLCLLTRAEQKADGKYTASAWLHQELGAALALNKPVVLMVEDGVTDLGGLQGDIQRIHFVERGFMSAAINAVRILGEYAGREAN